MSRTHLLSAVSAAALACISTGAFAQAITGGGSTLAEYDYFHEFSIFNGGDSAKVSLPSAIFNNGAAALTANESLYWASGSGIGQSSFLYNDLTCDAQKTLNGNKACPTGGSDTYNSAETIYGASDATLSAAQILVWTANSYTTGQSVAGNLIQLPSLGVGISFPVLNASVTTNSNITLTDADLCGVFSGKITDWSGVSGYKVKGQSIAAGKITVVYRSDSSGTSFLFWNHLKAVCNATNSAFNLTTLGAGPNTTFANIWVGDATPPTSIGESGSSAVAAELLTLTSATGYLSPDFTNVDPSSDALAANPTDAGLKPAYVKNAQNGKSYLPGVTNVGLGLNAVSTVVTYTGGNVPVSGDSPINAYAKPPASTAAWDPSTWVPLTGYVTNGYPVVGYTTLDFAQCYASKAVSDSVVSFLSQHYGLNATTSADYASAITVNGFVQIASTGAKAYVGAIKSQVLTASNKYAIGYAKSCKSAGGTGTIVGR